MTAIGAISAPPARHSRSDITRTGVVLMALWAVAAVGIVYGISRALNAEHLAQYGGRIAGGFLLTIRLVVSSVLIGAVISIPVAAGRLSQNRILGGLAYAYSYFFRGTPLIAQLFLIYYGAGEFVGFFKAVGLWWFFRDATNCAILSFAINTAAYQSEILAGAIRNVPRGQREAAAALGLHRVIVLWRIVMPQALITALRPYGNEVVLMVKASAIASIVTVLDLMGQTRLIFSKTYDLSFYLLAAVFYLVLVEVLGRTVNGIERRITRHIRRA